MRKRVQLILTVDYELFGNGSGSLEHCVRAPADSLMGIATSLGARLTFFVEALELQALEEAGQISPQEQRALASVKEQIRQAYQGGHDVQLHIHPQWLRATRLEDGGWRVDRSRWRTGDLSRQDALAAIRQGTRWLQRLLSPVDSTYRPVAFRAGGWCIQPATHVLDVLLAEGFRVDSSVAPGLYRPTPHAWYDFRRAPRQLSHWPFSDDVCRPDPDPRLVEIPIAAARVSRVRRILSWQRRRHASFAAGCRGTYSEPDDLRSVARSILARARGSGRAMLDFCTLDVESLQRIAREWIERRTANRASIPLVAIGHTKNFNDVSRRNFEDFLEWAADREDIEFGTFPTWLATPAE